MKPERQLVAERPVAQHCAELVRPEPGADELLPQLRLELPLLSVTCSRLRKVTKASTMKAKKM